MKVELAPIDTIKPYPNNPRKLSETAIEKVAQSIQEFGFRQPIVIDKDRIIVVGHTRYRASKKLGYKKVPVTIAENLTKEQINAYRIADNRTNEEAKWDEELLKMELKELDYKDFDLKMTGFDDKQINDLLFEEKQGLTDDDAVPDTPEEPISKLGDIWQLGKHRLLCGDATKEEDVNKLMNGQKADMVFTDPPYGVNYANWEGNAKNKFRFKKRPIENDNMNDEEFKTFLINFIINSKSNVKGGCPFYICYGEKRALVFLNSFIESGLHRSSNIIWRKQSLVLGRSDYHYQHEPIFYGWFKDNKHIFYGDRSQTSIWEFNRPTNSKLHPTMKPVELIGKAINNSSKQEDIIYEPFCGSGSTLIACEKLDRICYGIELDPKYCDVIVKRWEQWTGEKATK